MRKVTYSALAAAALLAGGVTTASAADLGGNCCADLEERIAELEATTARKGNRKVSLTISGHVAQQVMWWDDGTEDNVYITDTGSVSIGTHVKFSGQANIAPGWTAGYVVNIEFIQNDSLLMDQDSDEGIVPGNAQALHGNGFFGSTAIESSFWFVKSETLGKLSVGLQSSAADNQAILPDGSGSLVQANYVLYDVNAFQLKLGGAPIGFRYADLASCYPLDGAGGVSGDCDGYPHTAVRYDTPVFAGFSASASWGEDDMWAVSARYAGEFAGFKLAAAAAYNESKDENGPGGTLAQFPGFDAAAFQVGAYIEHAATGLFLYGAYSEEYVNDPIGQIVKPEGDMFYVKAGIRQRWLPLGHTVLYGEYGKDEDKMSVPLAITLGCFAGPCSSELERYGLGVVQEIDNAAMSMWLAWRHYEGEVQPAGAPNFELDEFDLVKGGALINF